MSKEVSIDDFKKNLNLPPDFDGNMMTMFNPPAKEIKKMAPKKSATPTNGERERKRYFNDDRCQTIAKRIAGEMENYPGNS
jgi:hypothetical protein